jgi:2,3-bisphosphoglycerate-dependent phosphoglycerate mutase
MFVRGSASAGLLVLARHGESDGNRLNIFTGWRDLPLTDRGRHEAEVLGDRLASAGLRFEAAFSSCLSRARESAAIILERLGQKDIVQSTAAFNERNYGDLTGLNKDEAAQLWGAEQVWLWRRSFELRPPGGESLRETANRVLPFYEHDIRPLLTRGQHVLVVAHGNSLRALIMKLQVVSPAEIETIELRTGEIRLYEVDRDDDVRTRGTL